jgi:hypothetical protein
MTWAADQTRRAQYPGRSTVGRARKAPDFIEPVVGWRAWRIVCDLGRYRLASLLFPDIWRPGQAAAATCVRADGRRRHPALRGECRCGIYAAASPPAALDVLAEWRDWMPASAGSGLTAWAIGEVRLWGRVVEAETGWRAARAYPGCILMPSVDGAPSRRGERLLQGLRMYGVPVETLPRRGGR